MFNLLLIFYFRLIMKALVYLKSSLTEEIKKNFHVVVSGFECNSKILHFFGPIESIQKAHKKFSELVAKLHKSEQELKLEGLLREDQLQSLQEKFSSKCFLHIPSHSKNVLLLFALESMDTDDIVKTANSMMSSSKTLDLPLSQVAYLQHFWMPHQAEISNKMTITNSKVNLYGTSDEVKSYENLLNLDVLPHVQCNSFSYACRDIFVSHIEQYILDEIRKEDKSFKCNCTYDSTQQEITVIISSKNEWFFCKTSKALLTLEPHFKKFSVGLPPDIPLKKQLEDKHRTVINCLARDSVEIGGLVAADIEECYKELMGELESIECKTESILISKYHYHYFTKFHSNDMKNFNEICKVDLNFSNEENKYSIEISGTVKQVKMAEGKLRSDLLAHQVVALSFCLSCPANLSLHWTNLWNKIALEKMTEIPNFIMEFSHSHHKSSMDFFEFYLIGKDSESACVQEVRDLIYDDGDGTSTIDTTVTFSDNGMSTFLKFRESQSFQFIADSGVWIACVGSTTVKLCTPVRFADNLTTVVEKLREYVSSNTPTLAVLELHDPIVQLVLSSSSLSESYLKNAHIEAAKFGASVELSTSKNGMKSFTVSASEYLISSSMLAIQKVSIEAIKKNITRKIIEFESIFRPLIETKSHFQEIKKKLESEHCAVCSFESDNENILMHTLHFQDNEEEIATNAIKINVVRGNLVLEKADAVVHFTTLDLSLDNDLSQLIAECAGPTVQQETADYFQSVPWQLSTGDAVCLGAGDLPCKSIIHSILPNWNENDLEDDDLCTALWKILEIAQDNSMKHISIPLACSDSIRTEIMHAYMLLKVMKDHYREFLSSSSLREISIVAKNEDSAHTFVDEITSHTCITVVENHPKCRTKAFVRKPKYKWSWRNDHKMYLPYDSDQSSQLSLAFNKNPKGTCTIHINSVQYTVDFDSMTQRNDKTLFKRKIKKDVVMVEEEEEPHEIVEWRYQADDDAFVPYSEVNSNVIEKIYQKEIANHRILINSRQYHFDLTSMSQVNVLSGFRRKIQRHVHKIQHDKDDHVDQRLLDTFAISIRGLHDELVTAEKVLVDTMNAYIQAETIGDIPANLPKELREKFQSLARDNRVMTEWLDSSDEDSCQTLTLRGVSYKVQEMYIAVHKELIKFKSLEKPGQNYSFSKPPYWELQTSDVQVFHVIKECDEWKNVEIKFKATMPSSTITDIQRIQNELIWKRYSFHKQYIEEKNKGTVNEMNLFHGSRENKPEDIYSGECGFDMRYSRQGMWGHANYFAVNASYSHRYAYREDSLISRLTYFQRFPSISSTIHSQPMNLTRQIFLAMVLVGEYYECSSNSSLIMPPLKSQSTKSRYDSVKGETNGSEVFMTYDNEKAYPAYLISYQ